MPHQRLNVFSLNYDLKSYIVSIIIGTGRRLAETCPGFAIRLWELSRKLVTATRRANPVLNHRYQYHAMGDEFVLLGLSIDDN